MKAFKALSLLPLLSLMLFSCGGTEQGGSGEPIYTHPKDEILILPGEKAFPESLFVKAVHMDDLTGILDQYRGSEGKIKEGTTQDYTDFTGDGTVDTLVHTVSLEGDSLRYSFDLRSERGTMISNKGSYPSKALAWDHWQNHKVYDQTYPWSALYYLPEVKVSTAVPDTTPPYIRRYRQSMQALANADSLPEVAAERAVSRFLSYMERFKGRHLRYWKNGRLQEVVWYANDEKFIPLIPEK